MAKKLFVRFAEAKDQQAVLDFYRDHPHPLVFVRDAEVWKERTRAGAVTLIEDEQGKIVASSISYPLEDRNGHHKWSEIGSTNVALPGVGLFHILLTAQIMRAYLLEPPEDRFVIEIDLKNAHSKHVFLKEGALPFDAPAEMTEKSAETVSDEQIITPVEWFHFGPEIMPKFAQEMLDLAQNPQLKNPKTGETFELDFSRCSIMSMFKNEIEKIAKSDLGDAKKPDMAKGVKASRAPKP